MDGTAAGPRFAHKTALVTGGGSGIGLGCARRLADEGANVTICGRNEDRLRAGVEVIGGSARYVVADVTDEGAIATAVEVAFEPTGSLDVIVANAGATHPLMLGCAAPGVESVEGQVRL